jgi:hypothetical protein
VVLGHTCTFSDIKSKTGDTSARRTAVSNTVSSMGTCSMEIKTPIEQLAPCQCRHGYLCAMQCTLWVQTSHTLLQAVYTDDTYAA